MINVKNLELYFKTGQNVLLSGLHGVGKTAVIKDLFEKLNVNWKYFSASTMDPWVDFIGIPKTIKRADGVEVLELIKPAEFEDDKVEAIFLDEFNRAPAKITNAVMELIQFKSINGRKFKNLKVVWAAINPMDEEMTYSVEKIDPAVLDRFQIKIDVPYELDNMYLKRKYKDKEKPFVKWWLELSDELKKEVSPRRLDYAISIYELGGDLKDVLPLKTNITKLLKLIELNQPKLEDFLNKKTDKELKLFFTVENSKEYIKDILSKKQYEKYIKFLNKEVLEQFYQTGSLTKAIITNTLENENVLKNISEASKNNLNKQKIKNNILSKDDLIGLVRKNLIDIIDTKYKYKISTFNKYLINLCYKYGNKVDVFSIFETLPFEKTQKLIDIISHNDIKNMNVFLSPSSKEKEAILGAIYFKICKNIDNQKEKVMNQFSDKEESVYKNENAIRDVIDMVHNTIRVNYSKSLRNPVEFIFGYNESNVEKIKNTMKNSRIFTLLNSNEFVDYVNEFYKNNKINYVYGNNKKSKSLQGGLKELKSKRGNEVKVEEYDDYEESDVAPGWITNRR